MEVLPAGRTWDPQQAEEAAGHPASEGDPEPQPDGRTSRTASLVSGLLTELYSCTEEEEVAVGGDRASQGRFPRRDSLDSSTETSGSDVFLGGRGAGDSRVLQELRERPSLRLQMQYLQRKGERGARGLLPVCATCAMCPPAPPAPLVHLMLVAHLAPPICRRPARTPGECGVSLFLTQDSTVTLSLDYFLLPSPSPSAGVARSVVVSAHLPHAALVSQARGRVDTNFT